MVTQLKKIVRAGFKVSLWGSNIHALPPVFILELDIHIEICIMRLGVSYKKKQCCFLCISIVNTHCLTKE